MLKACECESPESATAAAVCQECGTTCCRSCALEIGTRTYCRWCAPSRAALA